jgi:phage tail tape-measure protein
MCTYELSIDDDEVVNMAGFSTIARIGGRTSTLMGVGSGLYHIARAKDRRRELAKQSGALFLGLGAARGGAAIGALIGSLLPGPGTVIGTLAGGIAGQFVGSRLGMKAAASTFDRLM